MLSPNADCRIIWLHILGIHVRFLCAHIIVIFFGADTSKAQRAFLDDKFFGSLRPFNITYSMFIQMGHAIRDVVIITYKGGLSSLVPPSPFRTSYCSWTLWFHRNICMRNSTRRIRWVVLLPITNPYVIC